MFINTPMYYSCLSVAQQIRRNNMTNYNALILLYSKTQVDFAASTVAFAERIGVEINMDVIANDIPRDFRNLFIKRLHHYRSIYRRNN